MMGILYVKSSLNITFLLSNSWEYISQWFCASEEHVDPHTHAGPDTYNPLCVVWELSYKLPVQEPILGIKRQLIYPLALRKFHDLVNNNNSFLFFVTNRRMCEDFSARWQMRTMCLTETSKWKKQWMGLLKKKKKVQF